MTDSFTQEVERLHSEYKDIYEYREWLGTKLLDRSLSRRGQLGARIVKFAERLHGPADGENERANIIIFGPSLVKRDKDITQAEAASIEAASSHYADNADAYHQMAIDEAGLDAVKVTFKGDVAIQVSRLSLFEQLSNPN
jgi:hypothetical protein